MARWTDLARQAPSLTSIDLVLAEALIAAAERARFARPEISSGILAL